MFGAGLLSVRISMDQMVPLVFVCPLGPAKASKQVCVSEALGLMRNYGKKIKNPFGLT